MMAQNARGMTADPTAIAIAVKIVNIDNTDLPAPGRASLLAECWSQVDSLWQAQSP
jgi:hypothetical protein